MTSSMVQQQCFSAGGQNATVRLSGLMRVATQSAQIVLQIP